MVTAARTDAPSRATWMDLTRGLAVVLVIVFHAHGVLVTMGDGGSRVMHHLNLALGPHRMPLLMFLSGMLLARSLAKGGRRFVGGKLRGIGWPYLVWTTLTLLAAQDLTLDKWVRNLYSPTTPLWYLWFVLANYLLAYALLRLRLPATLIALSSLVTAGLVTSAFAADRFFFFFGFFMLGHQLALRWGAVSRLLRRRWVPLLGAAAAVVASWLAVTGHHVRFDALWSWGPLGLVVLVLAAAPALEDVAGPGRALRYIGRHSLVFYCTHWPVMLVTAGLLARLDRAQGALMYWTTLAVALGAGAVLSRALGRSRVVAALFTLPSPVARARTSRPPQEGPVVSPAG